MRSTLLLPLMTSLLAGLLTQELPAQSPAAQPIMRRLFEFQTTGVPTFFEEASPGKFLGVASITPLIFSITSGGSYKILYTFPPTSGGTVVASLFPAVNGSSYGALLSIGHGTFNELFSLSAEGSFTAFPDR